MRNSFGHFGSDGGLPDNVLPKDIDEAFGRDPEDDVEADDSFPEDDDADEENDADDDARWEARMADKWYDDRAEREGTRDL